jgi:phenylalanyl-tRNA synthetase beta chain
VDPSLPAVAIERATALLMDIVGGDPGPVQVTRAAAGVAAESELWVSLRRTRLEKLLGAAVPDAEVAAVLSAVSDRVEDTTAGWRVHRPPVDFNIERI